MLRRYFRRFPFAVTGILHALQHDFSYQMQVALITPAILVFGYVFWPLTESEIFFLGLAYALILITELQNSSFEAALDRLHPEHHEHIGKSKDMAAGATLTAGIFLIFVMAVIALA